MRYTDRIKIAVAADVLSVAVLAVTALLEFTDKVTMKGMAILIIIILIVGAVDCLADLYKSGGASRKWRNIWKYPIWQKVVYSVLAIAVIVAFYARPEDYYLVSLACVLVMVNVLIKDVRYYRYAVRYDMDELEDVNELIQRHPETKLIINRKKRSTD